MPEEPCQHCGRALGRAARFCAYCGTQRGTREAPPPSALAGLRRRLEEGIAGDRARVGLQPAELLAILEGLRHGAAERSHDLSAGHRAGGLRLTLTSGGAPVAVARLLYELAPLSEPIAALQVAWATGDLAAELTLGKLTIRLAGLPVASLSTRDGRIEDGSGALLGELPPLRQGQIGALSPTVAVLLDKPRRWPLKIFGAPAGTFFLPPQEGSLFAASGTAQGALYEPLRPLPAPAPELRAAVLACAVLACAAPDSW